jgi:ADP-heptose:LPS heptosyltransferase
MALLDEAGGELGKVVILRASRIGDFVCATPAFRGLRRALPRAEISLIGLPFVRPLVERSPHINRFISFPGFPGIAEQKYQPGPAIQFFERMQAERFDLAVQLYGSGVYSNPFTLMLGARRTVGFLREQDTNWRLDAACPLPVEGREVTRLLALLEAMGLDVQSGDMDFPVTAEDRDRAQRLLDGVRRPLIGVHTGARDAGKRARPDVLIAAVSCLAHRLDGTLVLLGPSRPTAGGCGPHRDLRGRTSLPVLGAVIEGLDLLVANDSAPAQIAYALGTPTVTRFLTTDPCRWGPPARERHQVVIGAGLDAAQQEQALLDAAERAIATSKPVSISSGTNDLTSAAARP